MAEVRAGRSKKLPALRGRTVVNLFFEDSTRTRSSFEIAGKWLSADVINISAKGSSVSKGESLRDTVLTVAAMGVDALVIRHHASGAPWQAAQWFAELGIDARVLNAGRRHARAPDPGLAGRLHPAPAFPVAEPRAGRASPDGRRDRRRHHPLPGGAEQRAPLGTLGAEVVVVAPPTLLPAGVGSWPVR